MPSTRPLSHVGGRNPSALTSIKPWNRRPTVPGHCLLASHPLGSLTDARGGRLPDTAVRLPRASTSRGWTVWSGRVNAEGSVNTSRCPSINSDLATCPSGTCANMAGRQRASSARSQCSGCPSWCEDAGRAEGLARPVQADTEARQPQPRGWPQSEASLPNVGEA